jgi:hypothetical protein
MNFTFESELLLTGRTVLPLSVEIREQCTRNHNADKKHQENRCNGAREYALNRGVSLVLEVFLSLLLSSFSY